jgi:hypothetical protein
MLQEMPILSGAEFLEERSSTGTARIAEKKTSRNIMPRCLLLCAIAVNVFLRDIHHDTAELLCVPLLCSVLQRVLQLWLGRKLPALNFGRYHSLLLWFSGGLTSSVKSFEGSCFGLTQIVATMNLSGVYKEQSSLVG